MSQRIGLIKPEHGFRGGFEVLIDQLVVGLRSRGHHVEIVSVDAETIPSHLYGFLVNGAFHQWHKEYFDYLTLAERCQRLALDDFDVVVATQPPTWLAPHDNMIALFFHQGRVFYDLSETFVSGGFADGPMHRAATAAIRSLDSTTVGNVQRWLAGSATTADRLRTYWNVPDEKILPYRHPAIAAVSELPPPLNPTSVAVVSRHEWPKRTELAVAAAHLSNSASTMNLIGTGSRLPYIRDLDRRLAAGEHFSTTELWNNRGPLVDGWAPTTLPPSDRVVFRGRLPNTERDSLVADSAVVVAPAFQEDYGLTALETFAARRPLIVCSDGGGLTEFVSHDETGVVCDPTPAAIAEQINRLINDQTLASRLANAGHEFGATFTLDRALDQFEAALS